MRSYSVMWAFYLPLLGSFSGFRVLNGIQTWKPQKDDCVSGYEVIFFGPKNNQVN